MAAGEVKGAPRAPGPRGTGPGSAPSVRPLPVFPVGLRVARDTGPDPARGARRSASGSELVALGPLPPSPGRRPEPLDGPRPWASDPPGPPPHCTQVPRSPGLLHGVQRPSPRAAGVRRGASSVHADSSGIRLLAIAGNRVKRQTMIQHCCLGRGALIFCFSSKFFK